MKKHICPFCLSGFFLVLSIFVLAGCASIPPDSALEQNWGRAFETQRQLQIANPDAGRQVRPVTEMDGASADAILDAYHKSFAEDCKEEKVNIIKLR